MNKLNKEQLKLLNWAIGKGIAAVNLELTKVENEEKTFLHKVVELSENNPFSSTQKEHNLKQAQSKLAVSSTQKDFLEQKKKGLEEILKIINS